MALAVIETSKPSVTVSLDKQCNRDEAIIHMSPFPYDFVELEGIRDLFGVRQHNGALTTKFKGDIRERHRIRLPEKLYPTDNIKQCSYRH